MRTRTRLLLDALARPGIWPGLAGLAWRFRRRRWYARPPFLPLPPPEYLGWRVDTAFGGTDAPVPVGLLRRYARWSRDQARATRAGGGRRA